MACAYYFQWKWIGYMRDSFITSDTISTCEYFFDNKKQCIENAHQNVPFINIHNPWRQIDLIIITLNLNTGDQSEQYYQTLY
jgi:hypothetical protein